MQSGKEWRKTTYYKSMDVEFRDKHIYHKHYHNIYYPAHTEKTMPATIATTCYNHKNEQHNSKWL